MALLSVLPLALPLCATADVLEVAIAFVGPADGDAWRGASQGLEEANAQGRFLGQHYRLEAVADAAAARALDATAMVAALPAAGLEALAAQAGGIPVFNVAAADTAVREACLAGLYHTLPGTDMLEDAVRQWRAAEPASTAHAQAWHPAFEKYAALQLNNRYTERHGVPMTDVAWAAWAAVKLVSDTVARAGDGSPAALVDALATGIAFDGQKGLDLDFRPTGQLRQPLLLIEDDHIVGEAPVRGQDGGAGLDSLGVTACAK